MSRVEKAGLRVDETLANFINEHALPGSGVEPRRFGDYATKQYLVEKNEEAYSHVFIIHYPDEERPACRPLRTAPCYERMKERGAVFGQKFGWERPNWFAPKGVFLCLVPHNYPAQHTHFSSSSFFI